MRLFFSKPLAEAWISEASLGWNDQKKHSGELRLVLESQIPQVVDKAKELLESATFIPPDITISKEAGALLTGSAGTDRLIIVKKFFPPETHNKGARVIQVGYDQRYYETTARLTEVYEWTCRTTGCKTGIEPNILRQGDKQNGFYPIFILEHGKDIMASASFTAVANSMILNMLYSAKAKKLDIEKDDTHTAKRPFNILFKGKKTSSSPPIFNRDSAGLLDEIFEAHGLAKPSEIRSITKT